MSVFINGMEMPTSCDMCWALDDYGDYPRCRITEEQRGYNFPIREKRMDNCPLAPVPPHGRLGDLDALAESVTTPGIFPPVVSSEVFAFLRNAPTIIPAELCEEKRRIKMEYIKIPNIFKREEFGKNRLIEGDFSSDELEFLADNLWVWTEKVDGTNIRVMWDGHSVTFGGRTDKAQIPAHLVNKLNELFGGTNKEEIFEQKFGETPVILFGEGFGEKIQKGGGLYGPVNFILFDAIIGNMWLRPDTLKDIADSFGIQVVPQVGGGSLYDAVKFIKTHPKSKLRDAEMEGIVCRPLFELADRRGNRIIVKIKCRDFPLEGE